MSRNGWLLQASVAVLASAATVAIAADEASVRLLDGPGVERVQASCAICHSLDYIVMNSPFMDKAGWEKTVTKMINVMGAPLTPEDSAAIVAYLDSRYGKSVQR